jgi:hypothetical protein
MSGLEAVSLDEMLAEIDALPPDDARRALAQALRESDADELRGWVIVGVDDGAPADYRQFLALGYVHGTFPPKYCLMPGAHDAETQAQIDETIKALAAERPIRTTLDDVRHLLGDGVKTLVHLSYARKRDTDMTFIVLWHHRKLALRRAVHLALLAISSDHAHRTGSGS